VKFRLLRRLAVLSLALFAWFCASAPPQAPSIILVRHAETEGTDPDRALSIAGQERASRLAGLLAGQKIDRVLSTDYRRTRATAESIAAARGLTVETYDPRDLPGVAASLKAAGGTVVVVGHSNTTPELVRLLGGDPGSPMTESDYDRIYRVDPATGATTMDRY
jgi:phosphohistidine phosphatase SixA